MDENGVFRGRNPPLVSSRSPSRRGAPFGSRHTLPTGQPALRHPSLSGHPGQLRSFAEHQQATSARAAARSSGYVNPVAAAFIPQPFRPAMRQLDPAVCSPPFLSHLHLADLYFSDYKHRLPPGTFQFRPSSADGPTISGIPAAWNYDSSPRCDNQRPEGVFASHQRQAPTCAKANGRTDEPGHLPGA